MEFTYSDGGRKAAGFKGHAGDCALRAVAVALQLPYGVARDELMAAAADYRATHRNRQARQMNGNSVFRGVWREVLQAYLESKGWTWIPTMKIGQGCTVHLKADELPEGRIIASVSKHYVAVIGGVAHDTDDPRRDGTRCVYGYFQRTEI